MGSSRSSMVPPHLFILGASIYRSSLNVVTLEEGTCFIFLYFFWCRELNFANRGHLENSLYLIV